LLYMFAALPTLRRRVPREQVNVTLIPGGVFVCWLVGGTGFLVTLLALIVAMVPPANSTSPTLFAIKVIGGCATLIAVGLVFYCRGRKNSATRN
jgi:hypothetical protein